MRRDRQSASSLLVTIADSKCKDALLELALGQTERTIIRRFALRAMNASCEPLSDFEFQSVVDLNTRALQSIQADPDSDIRDGYLIEFLIAIQSRQQVEMALTYFLSLCPESRSRILISEFRDRTEPKLTAHGKRVLQTLLDHWHQRDRARIDRATALSVAVQHSDHPESLPFILDSFKTGAGHLIGNHPLNALADEPQFQDLTRTHPKMWETFLERLQKASITPGTVKLFTPVQRQEHSSRAVKEIYRINSAIEAHKKIQVGTRSVSRESSESTKLNSEELRHQLFGQLRRALSSLLWSCTDMAQVESLLRGPTLNPVCYNKLARFFWARDPENATNWLREELRDGTSSKLYRVLSYIAGDPALDHEDILRSACKHKDPTVRYLGLHGAATLDLDKHVEIASQHLADTDIFLRLRAHGILAKHASEESTLFLTTKANDVSSPSIERAEAFRWLAVVDPVRHFKILAENLLHSGGHLLPMKEECAFGVARVGTDEALTILVKAKFSGLTNRTQNALLDYIRSIIEWNSEESCPTATSRLHRAQSPEALPGRAKIAPYPEIWRGVWPWHPGRERLA
ncbi:MAG: hypothetical protein P1V97_00880 [Planctomycetota bacterium]|nr:hypothetical protein [Planctomycetota bacterium]